MESGFGATPVVPGRDVLQGKTLGTPEHAGEVVTAYTSRPAAVTRGICGRDLATGDPKPVGNYGDAT